MKAQIKPEVAGKGQVIFMYFSIVVLLVSILANILFHGINQF